MSLYVRINLLESNKSFVTSKELSVGVIETDTQTDCQVLKIVFNIDFTDFPKSNLIVMRIYFFLLVSL